MSTHTLSIDGMTCASCVARVERALRKVPGVVEAGVNLATERALVRADPGVELAALLEAVRRAGYEASEVSATHPDKALQRRDHDPGWKVAVAVALSTPLVLPMLLAPLGVHLMLPPWFQALLAAPVQFWLGARFYKAGWSALRAGSGNMDLLVALGTSAAFGLSLALWAGGSDAHVHLYFESAAVVITLVMLGKWLESRAKRQTLASLEGLRRLRPERARVRRGVEETEIAVTQLQAGDEVVVRPGERLPADGVIVQGRTHLDESLLTGESLPVMRETGHAVVGGALNNEGLIVIRVTAVGVETQLSRIVRLVESAQAKKAPIQQLVDRISAVFVPTVVVLAALTGLGWLVLGADASEATLHAVSVLVIACPCALGLATPATLMVGTGLAARLGILVRDPQALEALRTVRVVAFDKTGTLTEGRPRLVDIVPLGAEPERRDRRALVADAAALQAGSEHPLARAVMQAAQAEAVTPPIATEVQAVPGRGIQGRVGDRMLRLCSTRWLRELGLEPNTATGHPSSAPDGEAGHSVAWLVEGDGDAARPRALLSFGDEARPGAGEAVAKLRQAHIRAVMVSGDHASAAAAVARTVGIEEVLAEVLPGDKASAVTALRSALPHGQTVAMVGDGVNDAPALAAADVGIAMAGETGGTDVAMETAGLTLMRADPRLVVHAWELSRAMHTKLVQNLFWAFAYNVVGIPLAAFGLLSPMVAGAAMALSSVSVIANALTLRRWRPSPGPSHAPPAPPRRAAG